MSWNPKVYYNIHKRPAPVRTLSHSSTVQDPILFLKIPLYYYPPIYSYLAVSFPQVISPNLSINFACLPDVPFTPLVSFFLI